MTVYIRPNGDNENDGSENGPGQITQARNHHRRLILAQSLVSKLIS